MGKCHRCGSDRLLDTGGKSSDLNEHRFKGITLRNPYVVQNVGIGGGDYYEFEICLECGQVQGAWPVPDPDDEALVNWEKISEEFPNLRSDLVDGSLLGWSPLADGWILGRAEGQPGTSVLVSPEGEAFFEELGWETSDGSKRVPDEILDLKF